MSKRPCQLQTTSFDGGVVAQGSPRAMRESSDPLVHQFFNAEPEGPVHFHYPAAHVGLDFGLKGQRP